MARQAGVPPGTASPQPEQVVSMVGLFYRQEREEKELVAVRRGAKRSNELSGILNADEFVMQ